MYICTYAHIICIHMYVMTVEINNKKTKKRKRVSEPIQMLSLKIKEQEKYPCRKCKENIKKKKLCTYIYVVSMYIMFLMYLLDRI